MDESLKIPKHIAIIMDGNGRWAKAHNMPRKLGHKQGCDTLIRVIEDVARLGVKYLTVYAFSTENWKRSEDEVNALMQLFVYYGKKMVKTAVDNNVKVDFIGDISRFSPEVLNSISFLREKTAHCNGLIFSVAVNYGSRDEMVRAGRRMLQDAIDGNLAPESLTEEVFSGYLDTAGMPDPDLLIRTSGEERLSNFLLWQLAYAEFYFTDVYWPDFNKAELVRAIEYYNGRDRRFGGRKEE